MGFAAFGVYDILILQDWFFPRPRIANESLNHRKKRTNQSEDLTVEFKTGIPPIEERTPIIAHFVAGSLAGLFHSLVMDSWEVAMYWWTHRRKESFADHWNHGVNKRFILRRLVHHSIGFATLFGIYESMRRWIVYKSLHIFPSNSPVIEGTILAIEESGLSTRAKDLASKVAFAPVASSFLAGGIAGQAHFVVSHYSSHWKLHAGKKGRWTFPKRPLTRSVIGSFLPTAISFLAFQYGGDLTAWLLEHDST